MKRANIGKLSLFTEGVVQFVVRCHCDNRLDLLQGLGLPVWFAEKLANTPFHARSALAHTVDCGVTFRFNNKLLRRLLDEAGSTAAFPSNDSDYGAINEAALKLVINDVRDGAKSVSGFGLDEALVPRLWQLSMKEFEHIVRCDESIVSLNLEAEDFDWSDCESVILTYRLLALGASDRNMEELFGWRIHRSRFVRRMISEEILTRGRPRLLSDREFEEAVDIWYADASLCLEARLIGVCEALNIPVCALWYSLYERALPECCGVAQDGQRSGERFIVEAHWMSDAQHQAVA